MSIRNFNTQPCGPCGTDTTHFMMKCRVCGAVNQTRSEMRAQTRRRLYARARPGKGGRDQRFTALNPAFRTREAFQAHADAVRADRAKHTAERRDRFLDKAQRGTGGVFGKGRDPQVSK